ncbi:MAG: hypothetical protein ACK5Y2_00225 [Bdellovibrionales bacterium]
MQLQERSYSSQVIRPRPLIYQDQAQGFLLMMTPWGSQEGCQKVMDFVLQFLLTSKQDSDLTTPFQSILSLSDEANALRVATLMANDYLYRTMNGENYDLVVETLFLSFSKYHVSWAQMGCPHLAIKKQNGWTQPISFLPETHSNLVQVPLPLQFLGVEPTIAPRCGDLFLEKGDELLFLSSSSVPPSLWDGFHKESFSEWSEKMVREQESQPFWLGRLKLDSP